MRALLIRMSERWTQPGYALWALMVLRAGWCVCVVLGARVEGRLNGGGAWLWSLCSRSRARVRRVCSLSLWVGGSCAPSVLCADLAACACAACRPCGVAACGRIHPTPATGCDRLLDIPV